MKKRKEKYMDRLNSEAERYSNEDAARMWTEENRTFREVVEETFKAGARWNEKQVQEKMAKLSEAKHMLDCYVELSDFLANIIQTH